MGRAIKALGGADFAATAQLKVEGAEIKGVYKGSREIKTKFGTVQVFALGVNEAKCNFTKSKAPYEPAEGETVEFMGTTTLTSQMSQVKAGETVTIKYKGLGKSNKGNPPHLFDVTVD